MAPKRKRSISRPKSTASAEESAAKVQEAVVETQVEANILDIKEQKEGALKEKVAIPDGRPKSGRHWKTKQSTRTSMDKRKGVNARLRKSFETHKLEREKKLAMKQLENEMKAEKQEKKAQEKARKEERERRRKENEFKTSAFQQINGEKLKKMSKKQLKNIAKTSMSKSGALELVPAYK